MAKTIQVVVDVESDSVKFATDRTLTLTQQVRLLAKELQKVPEGTKEWTTLQKAYNDTKDNLDRVNVKSKELFGTLSTLPGPIGDISAKLQGGIDLLKVFSSFTLKDLKVAFKGVLGDVGDVFNNLSGGKKIVKEFAQETQSASEDATGFAAASANVAASTQNATAATKQLQAGVYGVSEEEAKAAGVTNALSTANKELAVAEGTATVATGALKTALQILQATGILILITALVAGGKALYDFAFSTKEADDAAQAFNDTIKEQQRVLANDLSALDQANKIIELRAKLQGKSEKELLELQIKAGKDRLELLKANDNRIFQQQQELNKNTKISEEDRNKISKALAEESLKSNQAVIKQINDNEIASLNLKLKIYEDAKRAGEKADQEEIERAKKLLEEKKAFFREDFNAFEGALRARKESDTAFFNAEKYELDKRRADRLITEEEYDAKLLTLMVERNNGFAQDEKMFYEARVQFLKEGLDKKLITQREYDQMLIDLQRNYEQASNALAKDGFDNNIKLLDEYAKKVEDYKAKALEINKQIKESWIDLGENVSRSISSLITVFAQGSDLQKAFGVVSVLVNAAAAIGKIQLSAKEASADFSKTIATGTATIASGTALLSNPVTAVVGAAQVAAGKAAVATGTAGLAAVKANATKQTIGVGITSAAQIAAILAAKAGGGGATGGTGAGGGGGATFGFDATVNVPAPVIGASQAVPTGGLATTIAGAIQSGQSTRRPIRAYVVGQDLVVQAQLDRRIREAAQLGGI